MIDRRTLLRTTLVSLAAAGAAAQAQNTFDPLEMQKARTRSVTSKGHKVWYTRSFDLSGLPDYVPETKVRGTIRQWGNNYLADSPLAAWWEDAFRKFHPEVRFQDRLISTSVGMPALIAGDADIAQMGRSALWDEIQGFQRAFAAEPLEIAITTGSFNVPGWTFALGIFVNEQNPLAQLSFNQLDGIFGAARTGGWKGQLWDPSVARGPEGNIRRWGQLGLTGDWADRPINVYGYTPQFHFPDEFSKKVMSGSSKWNENIREYVNAARPDGSLAIAGDIFMPDLAKDRFGIAYTGIPHRVAGTKPLAVARQEDGPFVPLTLETVQDRSYPLTRDVYAYIHGEKPLDPKLREFFRFILSRQGQELVMKDGKYLPFTADAVREQRALLG